MKYINNKIIIAICISTLFLNCKQENDVCSFDSVCEPFGTNTPESGLTVVTYNGDLQTDYVATIYDTKNNAIAPLGADWAPTLVSGGKVIKPADWTLGKLGRVFGIAIDDNVNVYLASSGIYNQNSYNSYLNTNPMTIYKANAGTYTTSPYISLPYSSVAPLGSLNGIGNIAYDKINKQLFATNLDDGKIYRISTSGVSGSIINTYDPWSADTNGADITTQDERIWGIGVNYENGKVKLYFARITTPVTTLANRNIYSITLDASGNFPTTAPVLEVANVPGIMNAITDIEFSGDGKKMIIAERGDPHNAMTMSYNKSSNVWISNTIYFVGGSTGKNSAGGVDFAYKSDDKGSINCEEFIWSSGNYLEAVGVTSGRVYGLQGIKYSGNSLASAPTTDIFIDYNPPIYNFNNKGDIGDVDVFDANSCFCIKK